MHTTAFMESVVLTAEQHLSWPDCEAQFCAVFKNYVNNYPHSIPVTNNTVIIILTLRCLTMPSDYELITEQRVIKDVKRRIVP